MGFHTIGDIILLSPTKTDLLRICFFNIRTIWIQKGRLQTEKSLKMRSAILKISFSLMGEEFYFKFQQQHFQYIQISNIMEMIQI